MKFAHRREIRRLLEAAGLTGPSPVIVRLWRPNGGYHHLDVGSQTDVSFPGEGRVKEVLSAEADRQGWGERNRALQEERTKALRAAGSAKWDTTSHLASYRVFNGGSFTVTV